MRYSQDNAHLTLSDSPRHEMFPKHTSVSLDQNWHFKQANTSESWHPVSQFPTNIHLDLLGHSLIPDPNIGLNEKEVQWVGEETWLYRTTFPSPEAQSLKIKGSRTIIVFEGLDTFANVHLNGKEILRVDNMFVSSRVDVTLLLNTSQEPNVLEIMFESAYLKGWQKVEEHPNHKWGCWNGDNSRLAVRKAQYHWGWDWGPTLLTCGPWKPIRLEVYNAKIEDLWFSTTVDESLEMAEVIARADVEGALPGMTLKFEVSLDGENRGEEIVDINFGRAQATFVCPHPKLWYPRRYGKQPLYKLTATLLLDTTTGIHQESKKFGLRRASVFQEPLSGQPGSSFYFKINNIPIFCGGSNWIPADNFLPRLTPEKYHDWVKLAVEGNQSMIRVWGGGIYEHDAFYDACDELGILVWQDFLFGCGNYPAFDSILKSVEEEAVQNVKRLRHHPSIVIWAGNNEDYQYAESENLTYDYANKDAASWLLTDFPARYIYEKLLADVCAELIPDVKYHFGSPWGGGVNTRNPTIGDSHQWNIWHGTQEPYQKADSLTARFISEFGMQALPDYETVTSFVDNVDDTFSQSKTLDFHNKATGFEGRLALYLESNIRYEKGTLKGYVYATQLMQAECLTACYRAWKRGWKGPGREYCAGVLVWQLNDVYPCTSWSIVDHHLRPKAGYYAVKRELQDFTIGVKRLQIEEPENKYTRVKINKTTRLEIWGCNLSNKDKVVDVFINVWDIESGRLEYSENLVANLSLPANRTTEITDTPFPKDSSPEYAAQKVVAVYFRSSGAQVARHVDWPEPLKHVHFARNRKMKTDIDQEHGWIDVSCDFPVKGVILEIKGRNAGKGVRFDDNCIDLVPGEAVRIRTSGLEDIRDVDCRYLGMELDE